MNLLTALASDFKLRSKLSYSILLNPNAAEVVDQSNRHMKVLEATLSDVPSLNPCESSEIKLDFTDMSHVLSSVAVGVMQENTSRPSTSSSIHEPLVRTKTPVLESNSAVINEGSKTKKKEPASKNITVRSKDPKPASSASASRKRKSVQKHAESNDDKSDKSDIDQDMTKRDPSPKPARRRPYQPRKKTATTASTASTSRRPLRSSSSVMEVSQNETSDLSDSGNESTFTTPQSVKPHMKAVSVTVEKQHPSIVIRNQSDAQQRLLNRSEPSPASVATHRSHGGSSSSLDLRDSTGNSSPNV